MAQPQAVGAELAAMAQILTGPMTQGVQHLDARLAAVEQAQGMNPGQLAPLLQQLAQIPGQLAPLLQNQQQLAALLQLPAQVDQLGAQFDQLGAQFDQLGAQVHAQLNQLGGQIAILVRDSAETREFRKNSRHRQRNGFALDIAHQLVPLLKERSPANPGDAALGTAPAAAGVAFPATRAAALALSNNRLNALAAFYGEDFGQGLALPERRAMFLDFIGCIGG